MPEKSHPELERLAALMAAELLGPGNGLRALHVIKDGEHIGTWLKSNLTNKLSILLHENIEITK